MLKYTINERGSITVFLLLILIPSIIVTGVLIDLTRYNTAKQIVSGAGELALQSILANYDSLLKEQYGLFAISPTENYEVTIDKYFKLNSKPIGDDAEVSHHDRNTGFQLLQFQKSHVSISALKNANLANPFALKKQIIDYVKYRAPLEIAESYLESLNKLKNFSEEAELYEESILLSEKLALLSLDYQSLYRLLVFNDDFSTSQLDEFMQDSNRRFNNITNLFSDVYDIRAFLQNMEYHNQRSVELEQSYFAGIEEKIEKINYKAQKIITQQQHDTKYYRRYITNIEGIKKLCQKIKTDLAEVTGLRKYLTEKVENLAENNNIQQENIVRIKKQLEHCEELLVTGNFEALVEYIEPNIGRIQEYISKTEEIDYIVNLAGKDILGRRYFWENKEYSLVEIKKLSPISFLNPNKSGKVLLTDDMQFIEIEGLKDNYIKRFSEALDDEVQEIYKKLSEIYKNQPNTAGQKILKKAVDLFQRIISKKNDTSVAGAKEIPGIIVDTFSSKTEQAIVANSDSEGIPYSKTIFSQLKKGFSNFSADLRNKLLVQQYLAAMFTCTTTELEDCSLAGYTFTPKTNYLYGSELEYCLFGSKIAKNNLAFARALLFSLRYALNYKYALSNEGLMKLVESLALAGSTVVPLSGPALEISILSAIVAVETSQDMEKLLRGEKVVLFKTDETWGLSVRAVKKFFNGTSDELRPKKAVDNKEFKISYQDYLGLLALSIDSHVLLNRMGNLIELNMSYMLTSSHPEGLSELVFRTVQARTALQFRAEVAVNFIFLPLPFVAETIDLKNKKGMKIYYNNYRGY